MSLLVPLVAMLLSSSSAVVEKVVFVILGITYKNYSAIMFFAAFTVALGAVLIFSPAWTREYLSVYALTLVAFTTLTILTTNLLYYRALKHDHLSELTLLDLASFIPIGLVAALLFSDERNALVLIGLLVSSSALVWSHINHHKFQLRKETWPYFLWTFTVLPFEAAAFKEVLQIWDPLALQLVRDAIIALILGSYFFKYIERVKPASFLKIFSIGLFGTVGSILVFVSIKHLGITLTMLIFTLKPLLTYFASLLFLKEKFHKKKFIAFVIVLVSIAATQIMG